MLELLFHIAVALATIGSVALLTWWAITWGEG